MSSNQILFADPYYKDLVTKDLFELMGFTKLSDEKKEALAKVALETIEQRVLARILGKLSEQERKKLEKMFDERKFAEATKYIIDKKFDLEQIFAEEMLIYKNEMVQSANLLKNNLPKTSAKKEE